MEEERNRLMRELRHELHHDPELSGQERGTRQKILEFLRTQTQVQILSQEEGILGLLPGRSPSGKRIVFRCELDALPVREETAVPYRSGKEGLSHACGHDGHMAALCGLAMELSRNRPEEDVLFLFQPAEGHIVNTATIKYINTILLQLSPIRNNLIQKTIKRTSVANCKDTYSNYEHRSHE